MSAWVMVIFNEKPQNDNALDLSMSS